MDPLREQILRDWHDQWAKARKHGRLRYTISIAATAVSFVAGGAFLNYLIGIFPHPFSRDLISVLMSIPAGAAIGWIGWKKHESEFAAWEAQHPAPPQDKTRSPDLVSNGANRPDQDISETNHRR
jgi:hypothetical protein